MTSYIRNGIIILMMMPQFLEGCSARWHQILSPAPVPVVAAAQQAPETDITQTSTTPAQASDIVTRLAAIEMRQDQIESDQQRLSQSQATQRAADQASEAFARATEQGRYDDFSAELKHLESLIAANGDQPIPDVKMQAWLSEYFAKHPLPNNSDGTTATIAEHQIGTSSKKPDTFKATVDGTNITIYLFCSQMPDQMGRYIPGPNPPQKIVDLGGGWWAVLDSNGKWQLLRQYWPQATPTPGGPSASPTPTSTNTLASPSATPSATGTRTPVTPDPRCAFSGNATCTPAAATPTSTNTPGPSPSWTSTSVPPSATNTAVPPSPTSTNTLVPPTATSTNTAVPPTVTNTTVPPTPTSSNTPVPPTSTATYTATASPTASATSTASATPTSTPTESKTPTGTVTRTVTPSPTSTPDDFCKRFPEDPSCSTVTPTYTPTATFTPCAYCPPPTPATATASATASATATEQCDNCPTPTDCPVVTDTPTPTEEPCTQCPTPEPECPESEFLVFTPGITCVPMGGRWLADHLVADDEGECDYSYIMFDGEESKHTAGGKQVFKLFGKELHGFPYIQGNFRKLHGDGVAIIVRAANERVTAHPTVWTEVYDCTSGTCNLLSAWNVPADTSEVRFDFLHICDGTPTPTVLPTLTPVVTSTPSSNACVVHWPENQYEAELEFGGYARYWSKTSEGQGWTYAQTTNFPDYAHRFHLGTCVSHGFGGDPHHFVAWGGYDVYTYLVNLGLSFGFTVWNDTRIELAVSLYCKAFLDIGWDPRWIIDPLGFAKPKSCNGIPVPLGHTSISLDVMPTAVPLQIQQPYVVEPELIPVPNQVPTAEPIATEVPYVVEPEPVFTDEPTAMPTPTEPYVVEP